MGEAAKISLKAIGKQDTYLLSKDPDESFFNYTTDRRHSDFRKYHRSRNIVKPGNAKPSWPFNETIKVQFNPTNMGDLLSNMYLSLTMPGISDGNYADQLGRHILKSVTMFVDDIEVEKIHDDWGIIYDDLYLEVSEKVANRFLVNRNLGFDDAPTSTGVAQYDADLVIPIHFFFSRKFASDEYDTNKPNRPYFPVCSIFRQKIEFEFEFHRQTFFTNTTDTVTLPSFNVITEEITVNPDERKFLASERQTMITDLVRKHPVALSELNEDIIKNNLVPNIPVKCIHWFIRNTIFENEDDAEGSGSGGEYLYENRFNFSATLDFQGEDTTLYPVMKEASFYINGNKLPEVTKTNHEYYKFLIPYQKRLSRPIRNIYTYSFSLNPVNVEPSGNLDFSQIQSEKTSIEVKLDTDSGIDISTETFSLNMYYTGYQTFVFDRGFMSIAY
ncbi:hypothetical protein APZ24_gp205 [Ostreococcus lucimarinus virus 2]|jgi:hypothetical protein|uniref:hypothetical protein n=1 Tax=Ostreococcus lucimarinus virus 2 TaxID=1663208 RepID=UPI0006CF7AD4|nr:hypothetical protein APZ24_gp205 [Ostreococcus lucimarinus virus 2]ALI95606.1 hypothetical protein OlV2_243c [Ostreococcus lucimarinus virus 2]